MATPIVLINLFPIQENSSQSGATSFDNFRFVSHFTVDQIPEVPGVIDGHSAQQSSYFMAGLPVGVKY
jgi:hypothetical protein